MTTKQSTRQNKKISKALCERLGALRRYKNLTQKDVASKLGITFQQYQKYEKGTNRISVDMLFQLLSILDTSIAFMSFQGKVGLINHDESEYGSKNDIIYTE